MPETPDADRPPYEQPQADRPSGDRERAERQQLEALEEELRAAREKRDTYQGMLKELPEVFEGKFRERLRPVQQRNEQLLEEGLALRDQIRRALPQAEAAGRLPAASTTPAQPPATVESEGPGAAPPPTDGSLLGRLEGLLQPLQQRPTAALAAAAAALGIFLGSAAVLSSRQPRVPPSTPSAPAAPPPPSAQTPQPPASPSASANGGASGAPAGAAATTATSGPALLSVRTLGPSWIEVRGPAGELLFSDELNGARSFPLAQGLQIRSGRSDLVRIRVNGGPERVLGTVEDLGWKRFPAATPEAGRVERQQP